MKRKAASFNSNDTTNKEKELSVRKRINFDSEDEEITFDTQAHKKRKLSKEMEELKLWIGERFDESKAETKKLITESISATAARGKKNEEDMAEIRESISNIERRMGINTPARGSYAGATAVDARANSRIGARRIVGTNQAERTAFLKSRRSLRLWPIEGETKEQLMESTINFCCQALQARQGSLGLVAVTRTRSAPRGTTHMEVLAEFADNIARDDILSRGPMLADF